jgi:hypothetical protein
MSSAAFWRQAEQGRLRLEPLAFLLLRLRLGAGTCLDWSNEGHRLRGDKYRTPYYAQSPLKLGI